MASDESAENLSGSVAACVCMYFTMYFTMKSTLYSDIDNINYSSIYVDCTSIVLAVQLYYVHRV